MVCNGICSGNQECCCNGANETCGSMYKLLIIDMVKNTGRVEQMANRYIEGKADEYSSKRRGLRSANNIQRAWQDGNPGNKQKVRNQKTKQHEKTRLKLK